MSHDNHADVEVEVLTRRNFIAQTVFTSCACAAACIFAAGDADAQTPKKPAPGAPRPPGGGPKEAAPVPKAYTVGAMTAFAKQPDGIYDKFAKAPGGFLVAINEGKVYAMSSVCTHKKRLIRTYEKDKKQAFCPGHSSVFDLDGTPTPVTPDGDQSPAREPLPRHGISVNAKGQLVVDTTKSFTFEQREEEGAFVKIEKKPAAAKEPAKPAEKGGAKKTTGAAK